LFFAPIRWLSLSTWGAGVEASLDDEAFSSPYVAEKYRADATPLANIGCFQIIVGEVGFM